MPKVYFIVFCFKKIQNVFLYWDRKNTASINQPIESKAKSLTEKKYIKLGSERCSLVYYYTERLKGRSEL